MAETQGRYRQQHGQYGQHYGRQSPTDAMKSMLPERGPSAAQVVAVITLLPLAGLLLTLAGLSFAGTVIGLAVSTPVFILFSPVLVPAALTIGLAVTGFLTSGACGITGMSSMVWILNYLRQVARKRQIQEGAGQVGHRT